MNELNTLFNNYYKPLASTSTVEFATESLKI